MTVKQMPRPDRTGVRLRKVNAMSFAKLIDLLLDGAYTMQELAEKTGLHPLTVGKYCYALHKEGAIHVGEWTTDSMGRHLVRIYIMGRGPDAKRPKATPAERQRRVRARAKAAKMIAVTTGRMVVKQVANGRLRFDRIEEKAA